MDISRERERERRFVFRLASPGPRVTVTINCCLFLIFACYIFPTVMQEPRREGNLVFGMTEEEERVIKRKDVKKGE